MKSFGCMPAVRTPEASRTLTVSCPGILPSPLRDKVGAFHHDRFRGYVSVHSRSGLHPPCLRFAVAVAGHHARLGTRLLVRLCRGRHHRRLNSMRLQGATPTPPGIRVTYHGGSTGLSLDKDMESGETDRVEVAVGQCLLNRRVSGHAPEPRRRTGGDRCTELRYATTAQFVEAVVPVLPLPPKIRA